MSVLLAFLLADPRVCPSCLPVSPAYHACLPCLLTACRSCVSVFMTGCIACLSSVSVLPVCAAACSTSLCCLSSLPALLLACSAPPFLSCQAVCPISVACPSHLPVPPVLPGCLSLTEIYCIPPFPFPLTCVMFSSHKNMKKNVSDSECKNKETPVFNAES
jgi:hypothetical protein